MDEVCKQQTIIGQASQALNLCHATVEFTGSREQVEGERLLLVASTFFFFSIELFFFVHDKKKQPRLIFCLLNINILNFKRTDAKRR